jgi:hypothetical protein
MDKYLLLIGFQLTQTAVIGATSPAVWDALQSGSWKLDAGRLDLQAFGVLAQAALSGTWLGRVTEFGNLLGGLLTGAHGLPLALLLVQWGAVIALLIVERRVLARRLSRLEASLDIRS